MDITGKTRLICLLGSPVEHSLSPQMHNLAFQTLGLPYSYMAFDLREKALPEVLRAFRSMGVRGCNLTMPLKNAVLPFCDSLSPAAALSGAVNTLVFEPDGSLHGYTTDGAGFLRALTASGIPYRGRKLVLLGTGGAGMAILVQAALSGAGEIAVFVREGSRFRARAEACLRALSARSGTRLSLHFYETAGALAHELETAALLVNASNVGMEPNTEGCLLPDASLLHAGLAVADVIYSPRRTRLLRMAEERGLPCMNGLSMLLYQGAEAFRLWTGEEMPVELIYERYFRNTGEIPGTRRL
ncbi:MAG: shikimate dehydrogenase [Oribacterium sp.]